MGTDEQQNINPETAEVLHEALNDALTAMYLGELERGELHDETDHLADLRTEIEEDVTGY